MKTEKTLNDLNLLDRFLFAEAMENPENVRILLEIILGKEIVLKHLPQTEKEGRTSPLYRHVRFDVFAQDEEDTVYETEVQKKNTNNLPKRSRYYESFINVKLLESGEDFSRLSDVFIIVIAPFDIFGEGRYMYTFQMYCKENRELPLEDGAVRIFLNTRGRNDDEVSRELVELLKYIESSNQETADRCESERIHQLQERIQAIKSSEEVSVKYMLEWEERELDRREAREEGLAEGLARGKEEGLRMGQAAGMEKAVKLLIEKKLAKGKSIEVIAEELEETPEVIKRLIKDA